MRLHVHVHLPETFHLKLETVPNPALAAINTNLTDILMKLSEALELLKGAKEKLAEGKTEILAKLEELKNTDPDLSPEGAAIIGEIADIATALADVVPNTPPVDPPAEPA